MFNNIFAYIDKIMKIVKPKKKLMMAIGYFILILDGVAPRAKMN
jgi:5'-3' exonuclease